MGNSLLNLRTDKGRYVWSRCEQLLDSTSSLGATTEKSNAQILEEQKEGDLAAKRSTEELLSRTGHKAGVSHGDNSAIDDGLSGCSPKRLSVASHQSKKSDSSERTITPQTIEYVGGSAPY